MITQTTTWSLFYDDDGSDMDAEDLGIVENKDLPLKTYLQELKKHKKRFKEANIAYIAVYHTVFYEGQCNTEFDPEVIGLLHELKATFCVTTQEMQSNS